MDASGLSSSRFGPTCPFAFAAESVWQPPQPALAKTLAPGEFERLFEPPQALVESPIASRSAGVRKRSFMARCLGTIALWL